MLADRINSFSIGIDDEIFERKEKEKKTKKRSEKWCANRAKGDDKGIPDDRRVIIVDGLGWAGSLDVWYFR